MAVVKEPHSDDKEALEALINKRELRESAKHEDTACESSIVYTDVGVADVTFWLNGEPYKAVYERNNKGVWYCARDWRD